MDYFKGSKLAQMSDGSYRIVRPLGLVKGGKGLKCHKTLLSLSARGFASKLVEVLRQIPKLVQSRGAGEIPRARDHMSEQALEGAELYPGICRATNAHQHGQTLI